MQSKNDAGSIDQKDTGPMMLNNLRLISSLIIFFHRAKDLRDGTSFVALKKIRMKLTEEGVPLSALREIAILRRMDKYEHPNIVRLAMVIVS